MQVQYDTKIKDNYGVVVRVMSTCIVYSHGDCSVIY